MRPPLFADEWNEYHRSEILLGKTIRRYPAHAFQVLNPRRLPHWNQQPASDRQLLLEGFGNARSACGHEYRIERGVLRPAERTVALTDLHIVVAEAAETIRRQRHQVLVELHAVDL